MSFKSSLNPEGGSRGRGGGCNVYIFGNNYLLNHLKKGEKCVYEIMKCKPNCIKLLNCNNLRFHGNLKLPSSLLAAWVGGIYSRKPGRWIRQCIVYSKLEWPRKYRLWKIRQSSQFSYYSLYGIFYSLYIFHSTWIICVENRRFKFIQKT